MWIRVNSKFDTNDQTFKEQQTEETENYLVQPTVQQTCQYQCRKYILEIS